VHGRPALLALFFFTSSLQAYSVLTHEAIIDTVWDHEIKTLLKKRYPLATEDELLRAHASAYGGCIIQDMGYYPFGSTFFSDLVHYVRTGDFVVNQVREARTLNELAFALGSLAHYAADTQGHSGAINLAVAIEYPKLAGKYGKSVTYADDKVSHMRVEFSFDVAEVAKGHYAPQAYHDFIGFEVEKGVLERAFVRTYSLELKDVFGDLDLALGTYRRAVSILIPEMTRIAWHLKKDELAASKQRMTISKRQFVYNLSRASYRKEWKDNYREPGIWARILAFLMRILPKVGPLKALSFKPPTAQTLNLFETSFNRTLEEYRNLLRQESSGKLALDDRDFDTGLPTRPTEYRLADDAYAKLARELAKKDRASINPEMLHDILAFYRDPNLQYATRKDRKKWAETLTALEKLRAPSTAN
jgi:hypothetical protein